MEYTRSDGTVREIPKCLMCIARCKNSVIEVEDDLISLSESDFIMKYANTGNSHAKAAYSDYYNKPLA